MSAAGTLFALTAGGFWLFAALERIRGRDHSYVLIDFIVGVMFAALAVLFKLPI